MSAQVPVSADKFLDAVGQSGLLEDGALEAFRRAHPEAGDSRNLAAALVRAGLLTQFQVRHLLSGRYRGLVLGSYKLLDEIGRGGMGTVFLAEHKSLKRRAAVKVLTAEPARSGGGSKGGRTGSKAAGQLATERFYREARTAAALSHPNIVRVFDVSQFGSVHYIAMEYVEGRTLAQMVDANGPLHFAQACDYVAQACAGLQEAYSKGLVHRDIKPDNLIVDKAGVLKILDLGLARVNDSPDDRLTAQLDPDAVLGTPDFIAPEQAVNAPVDIRADIYSLGVTFYALVTGRPPFSGTTAQKLMQHQLKDAPSLTNMRARVPAELAQIIARMMAKKPADRFQTPADVIEALAPWLSADAAAGTEARTVGSTLSRLTSRTTLTAPRRPAKWVVPAAAGGSFLGVSAAIAAVVFLVGGKKPGPDAPPPGPQAAQNPAVVAPAPGTPAPADRTPRVVYRFDVAGVEPFSLVMETRNATEAQFPGRLPAPWRAEVYKDAMGSSAAIKVQPAAGGAEVTLANLTNIHCQLFTNKAVVSPKPRCDYKLRVEYRTAGDGYGEVGIRNAISGLQSTQRAGLPRTDGEWRTAEFEVEPAWTDKPLFFFVQNLCAGPDNALTLRSLEVLEQAK